MTSQDHEHELLTRGYTIIENVLDVEQIAEARNALGELFEREKDIASAKGWLNKSYRISYAIPVKHELFRQLPFNQRLLPLMQKILGKSCMLSSLNGMTMSPGGETQGLHLDQFEHTPGMVVNINATHALDDFTKANGCTRVVPFSQNRETGTPIDRERDERDAVYLEAPAGSVIAFNGGLVHAGSQNTTQGWRRCLHFFYCRPWARTQWDFARSFAPEVASTLNEEQKRLFGFYSPEQRYDFRTHQVTRGYAVSA